MAAHTQPMPYSIPVGPHPSSPPMTPGGHVDVQFPPPTSHTNPLYKHMGLSGLSQSPPLEFIEPGESHSEPNFTRPQSRNFTSRPSTVCASDASESECETDSDDDSIDEDEQPARIVKNPNFQIEELDSESEYETDSDADTEDDSDAESTKENEQPARIVKKGNFQLEELDSDSGYTSKLEVIRPDQFEDAKSEKGGKPDDILNKLKDLRCSGSSSEDEEEMKRRYERRKKRWSAGIFKRTHAQSIEGDSSYSDDDPLDDNDSTARRLRRRVRGPGDRTSLIFEDRGFSNANNIIEDTEPEEGGVPFSQGPPSIPSDDGFTLDELPFWSWNDDSMDLECESVGESVRVS